MKYYHIIYNSSEKPMDGGVGFGIRTATEGTPQELLKAVKGIKFFTDDWETYDKKPTPAQMKENPSAIEAVPRNYAVTSLNDEQGKTYYVVARRAYVGFDYGFYKSGNVTRPGNYVIDFYVFDTAPESSVYQILYENALPGSNHFIPESVQPVADNAEMKEISVGAQPPLPVSDKPFTARVENVLDKDVVVLFFHYLKARQHNRKLVVRANPAKALRLMADLYRMLEPETARTVRVYLNLRSQGVNDNFDIYFIHEDYPHQVYTELYDYIEADTATLPDTEEAKVFGASLTKLVTATFDANRDDVYDTLKWLMMPEYNLVKSLGKRTNESFFCYCIQPGNFMYDNLMDAQGRPDDELLGVLAPYTRKEAKNAARFNLLVAEAMNEATPQNVIGRVGEYNHFMESGFDLERITEEVKQNVCAQLLSDVRLFRKALDTHTLDGLKKFFVKEIFESRHEYADTDVLDTYMLSLYKWFLTDAELAKKENMLYGRFMKRDMAGDIFCTIVDDVFGSNPDVKIKFFAEVLHEAYKPFAVVWPYMQKYLNDSAARYDFLEEFAAKNADEAYAPMFYYSILRNKALYDTPAAVAKLAAVLKKNEKLHGLVAANYEKEGIYTAFYHKLKEGFKKNPEEAFEAIRRSVIDVLPIKNKRHEYYVFAVYLQMVCTASTENVAKYYTNNDLKLIYDVINEQADARYFGELLPLFVRAAGHGIIEPKDLAAKYREYNPEAGTLDMLRKLVADKSRLDMIAAVCEVNQVKFKEALELAEQLGLNSAGIESFMTEYYAGDYKSYKFKHKVKNVFSSFKNIFGSKKKEDDGNDAPEARPDEHDGQTDSKPTDKKK